mmetsp:Transcript_5651/g.8690  ORF Transcript_5651/g.8690 Transcript_5651/m.8690 type:complete len:89 (-) Transcript_5651:1254-1520(-)
MQFLSSLLNFLEAASSLDDPSHNNIVFPFVLLFFVHFNSAEADSIIFAPDCRNKPRASFFGGVPAWFCHDPNRNTEEFLSGSKGAFLW